MHWRGIGHVPLCLFHDIDLALQQYLIVLLITASYLQQQQKKNPNYLLRFMSLCILMQLGPKAEDVTEPVNPFVFLWRLILGALAATYYVLVPIYMWLKDQVVPKGQPI